MAALRAILAELEMKVRGSKDVKAADVAVNAFAASLRGPITALEKLRIKEQESSEMARRLRAEIRKLQAAEGDQTKAIITLRRAEIRATEAAKAHKAEITKAASAAKRHADRLAKLKRKTDAAGAAARRAARSTSRSVGAWQSIGLAVGAVTVALVAAARVLSVVTGGLRDIIELGDDIDKTSQRLGLSASELQRWRFIAERGGVSTDSLSTAFRTMSRNADMATQGSLQQARAFRLLNVELLDTDGNLRSQADLFQDAIIGLSGLESVTQQAAIAQQIWGRSGTAMIPIANDGAEGIRRLTERFEQLGGGLSDETVEASRDAADAAADMDLAWTSLKDTLAVHVLPALAGLARWLGTAVGWLADLSRHSSIVQVGLVFLGAALAALTLLMVVAALPIVLLIAALGLLFIAVEDVVTAFRGGQSVFGAMVETFLELIGVTMTFPGVIAQFGVAWASASATAQEALLGILEAVQAVQEATGVELFGDVAGAITTARVGAAVARTQATTVAVTAREQEATRTRGATAGGSVGGSVTQHINTTIEISGSADPEAVANAARRQQARVLRDAADTLPLAPAPA